MQENKNVRTVEDIEQLADVEELESRLAPDIAIVTIPLNIPVEPKLR